MTLHYKYHKRVEVNAVRHSRRALVKSPDPTKTKRAKEIRAKQFTKKDRARRADQTYTVQTRSQTTSDRVELDEYEEAEQMVWDSQENATGKWDDYGDCPQDEGDEGTDCCGSTTATFVWTAYGFGCSECRCIS
jgi:hypothetical protein